MLLALTTASGASEITHLDIRYMVKSPLFYCFTLSRRTKVMKSGNSHPKIMFIDFEDNKNLCVCKALGDYLKKTVSLRDGETNLLIATIKPRKKVAVSTVSRWLRDVLQLSGININIFKAHSTRSASTSKAFLKGASVEKIMKTAYWSNENTFRKFYNRKLVEANSFQSTVIESFKQR